LEILLAKGNALSDLPASFRKLRSLEKLDLSYCMLEELEELPQSVTDVNLRNNELNSILGVAHLTGLKKLQIQGNSDLATLPALCGMKKLRTIIASDCKLVSLPPAMDKCIALRKIDFGNCNLTSLPDEICNCKHIENIDVSNNALDKLPAAIGTLKKLKALSLNGNKIKQLPQSFSILDKVERLNGHKVSSNTYCFQSCGLTCVKSLFAFLEKKHNMTSLSLAGNQLEDLPSSISQMANLQKLDLHNTKLKVLPPAIKDCTSLQSLRLRGCTHGVLENASKLTGLKLLDVVEMEMSETEKASLRQMNGCIVRFTVGDISGTYRNPRSNHDFE
jgi:Leucine-rich repeat (LRR) protein